MSRASSPSILAPARIPKITDLRDELGYGNLKFLRCTTFVDDLRVFRRRYRAGHLRGCDLLDWKSSEQQAALKQMTAAFLDEEGYGEIYWPSDRTATNYNTLQYSEHRTFIMQTMRQLIFRLNLQQFRNEKYKKKGQHNARETSELDDEELETRLNFPNFAKATSPTSPLTTASTQTYAGIREGTRESPVVLDSPQQEDELDGAVYDTPDYTPESTTRKRKSDLPNGPKPKKRSKIVSLHVGAFPPHRRLVPAIPSMSKRTSPRGKNLELRPNYTDIKVLDKSVLKPTDATKSISSRDYDVGATHQINIRQRGEECEEILFGAGSSNGSVPPTLIAASRTATIDSNIDPNLERTDSSPSFFRSSPGPPHMGPRNSTEAEAEQATSPTHTISALGSSHKIDKTSGLTFPLPSPSDVNPSTEQVRQPLPPVTSNPVPDPSGDTKAGISFHYEVILSRTPIYEVKGWHPKGHFLEKSLSELVEELPFENRTGIIGLIVRLTGPGVRLEQPLERGQDAEYNRTKKRITQMVKMCLKNHKKESVGGRLVMDFEIEAVREGGVEEDDDDDDDDDAVMF